MLNVSSTAPIHLGAHITLTDDATGAVLASFPADSPQFELAPGIGWDRAQFGDIGPDQDGLLTYFPGGVEGATGAITCRGFDKVGVAISGAVDLTLTSDPSKFSHMSIRMQ